jgi:hypothetical protein
MTVSHDHRGRRIPDGKRVSKIGAFLRRTRLDELPQLYNILAGQMSFVGPRPLLAAHQPNGFPVRLAVRPGLTGWAQIHGGQRVSPADKAALDQWYVENASLLLDVRIMLRTFRLILRGEPVETVPYPTNRNQRGCAWLRSSNDSDDLETTRGSRRPSRQNAAANPGAIPLARELRITPSVMATRPHPLAESTRHSIE